MSSPIERHPDSPPPSEGLKAPGKAEKQIRILAVDDEPALLKSTARLLSKAGYSVVTAIDGLAALKAYGTGKFDLVFSDFNMPRMNGLALLRELKGNDPAIKVVTYAGGLTSEQQSQLKEAGVFEIIAKPADTAQILAVVKKALGGNHFESQEPLAENIIGNARALARVMYVDDDEAMRDAMVDVGEYLGFTIQTAACGRDAIVLFLKNRPDVIVSDFHMPEMNGLELLCAIKALDPAIKVIIMTAGASPEEKSALLDAGAFTVLQKPVDLAILSNTVSAALAE